MTKVNWTEWNGGDCPVSEKDYTIVKLRNGWVGLNVYDGLNRWAWKHMGFWNDIVKYSVVDISDEQAPTVDVGAVPDADEIVTQLYKRFRDWHQRGFGPDDVTWCEVRADVMKLIASAPQPPAPALDVEAVRKVISSIKCHAQYSWSVEGTWANQLARAIGDEK